MFDRASSVTCRRSTSLCWNGCRQRRRNELVELGNLPLALRVLRFNLRADLGLRHHHVIVSAGIDDGFVIHIGDAGAHPVQEVTVVRDHNHHAVTTIQESLQPVDGVQIQTKLVGSSSIK